MLTPKNLLSDHIINTTEIETICNQHGVDSDMVAAELPNLKKHTIAKQWRGRVHFQD